MMFLPPDVERCVLDFESNAKIAEEQGKEYLANTYCWIAECLRYSVKIVLPDNGEVYRHNHAGGALPSQEECFSLKGLPAPCTSLVYRWTSLDPQQKLGKQCFGTRRITLIFDMKQIVQDYDSDKNIGVIIYSLFYAENAGTWDMSPIAIGLHDPYHFEMIAADQNKSSCDISEQSWTWMGKALDLVTGNPLTLDFIEQNETYAKTVCEMRPDINAVIQCVHSLRAGASLKEQKHKSPTRRKKMQRKGVGGFTYHVLRLPYNRSGHEQQSGTHASPRFHVRRAHIRKLPSGALTFVRQCFVGDKAKGIVDKDYQLAKAND